MHLLDMFSSASSNQLIVGTTSIGNVMSGTAVVHPQDAFIFYTGRE